MENEALAEKFRNAADAVIDRYREEYRRNIGIDDPSVVGRRAETDHPLITHPSIDGFLGRHWTDIVEMDEFVDACEYAVSNFQIVSEYHSQGEELGFGIDKILLQFITDLLGYEGWGMDYSESDFETVYSQYEADLLSDTLRERTFVCLQGLELEGELEKIELNDHTVIRELNEHDEQIVNHSNSPESMFLSRDKQVNPVSGPRIEYILEIWFDVDKETRLSEDFPDYVSERSWGIRNALTALRLVNESDTVNYARKYTENRGAWETSLGGGGGVANQVSWLAEYRLSEEDVDELRQVYRLLQSKDFESIDSDIKMAVNRFNSAMIRPDSEWRIEFGDMIIILEALLSKKRQISERELAQKTAILLGDSHDERTEIYEDIRELYDKRSGIWGIAHGGGRKELQNQDELLDQARHYGAESLLKVLQLEKDFGGLGNLLKEMDERVGEQMLNVDFP